MINVIDNFYPNAHLGIMALKFLNLPFQATWQSNQQYFHDRMKAYPCWETFYLEKEDTGQKVFKELFKRETNIDILHMITFLRKIKLSELKKQILDENLFNNYVENLKNDGIVNQEKGNEQNGNDTSGNDGNVLEISSTLNDDELEIVVKTRSNKKPSEIVIDGESNSENKIKVIIKDGKGKKLKDEDFSEAENSIKLDLNDNNIISKNTLVGYDEEIKEEKEELEDLVNEFISNKNNDTKKEINKTKKSIKDKEKSKKEYINKNVSKVKVITFLTKNKKKTKTEKTFTITENGVE